MGTTNTVYNEPSILVTIKKLLGIEKEYDSFDTDIIVHINAVMSNLFSAGIGPEDGFMITGNDETWDQYITEENPKTVQSVKTYIYLKVKIVFDPPANSTTMTALENSAKEIEYRLYTEKGGY